MESLVSYDRFQFRAPSAWIHQSRIRSTEPYGSPTSDPTVVAYSVSALPPLHTRRHAQLRLGGPRHGLQRRGALRQAQDLVRQDVRKVRLAVALEREVVERHLDGRRENGPGGSGGRAVGGDVDPAVERTVRVGEEQRAAARVHAVDANGRALRVVGGKQGVSEGAVDGARGGVDAPDGAELRVGDEQDVWLVRDEGEAVEETRPGNFELGDEGRGLAVAEWGKEDGKVGARELQAAGGVAGDDCEGLVRGLSDAASGGAVGEGIGKQSWALGVST